VEPESILAFKKLYNLKKQEIVIFINATNFQTYLFPPKHSRLHLYFYFDVGYHNNNNIEYIFVYLFAPVI
jgi:hypothetical protein